MNDEELFEEAELLDEGIDESFKPWNMDQKHYCMLLHLSPLAGGIIPVAGLILPIIMYATNKEHSRFIEETGRNVLNWMITSVIFLIVAAILGAIIPPFMFLLGAIAVIDLIFMVIGALKANEGIVYKYPLTIEFIK